MTKEGYSLEEQLADLLLRTASCLKWYRAAAQIGKKRLEEDSIRSQIYLIRQQLSDLEHDIMAYHDPYDDIPF